MGKEVKEMMRIINNCLEIGGRVKKYVEEKGDVGKLGLEELNERKKDIEELRKKILNTA